MRTFLLTSLLICGCNSGTAGKSFDESVAIIRENFDVSEEIEPMYALINASDGIKMRVEGKMIEVYEFTNTEAKQSFMDDGGFTDCGQVVISNHPRAKHIVDLLK